MEYENFLIEEQFLSHFKILEKFLILFVFYVIKRKKDIFLNSY